MHVAPSPLNGVKLEWAILLVVGILLLLVQGRLIESVRMQLLILAAYSLCGGLWIVFRARQIVQQHPLQVAEALKQDTADGPHTQ